MLHGGLRLGLGWERPKKPCLVFRVSCLVKTFGGELGLLQDKTSDGPLLHFASPRGEKCRLILVRKFWELLTAGL